MSSAADAPMCKSSSICRQVICLDLFNSFSTTAMFSEETTVGGRSVRGSSSRSNFPLWNCLYHRKIVVRCGELSPKTGDISSKHCFTLKPRKNLYGIIARYSVFVHDAILHSTRIARSDCTASYTMKRSLVEVRNGHIKSVFQFFEGTVSMNHVINVGVFYRIAGAILNKYREPIIIEGVTAEVAERMLEKSRTPNVIQARVEIYNVHTRNARWDKFNANHIPYFPRLDYNYLTNLTMGIYQLKLAPAYIQDKLQREQAEQFQIDELLDERGLIRVRMYFRFINVTKYQLWIAYIEEDFNRQENEDFAGEEPNEPILGYYCT